MSSLDRSFQTEPSALQISDSAVHDPKRRRSILITVSITLMAVTVAVTGLNVVQAHLALDLAASQSQVLCVINIYAISLASLLLPLGAAGDRWDRKSVLLIAPGLSPSTELIMVARFLSAVGSVMAAIAIHRSLAFEVAA